MTREFPPELLSAYLDGELSPAERSLVEERLAASDADRQLLAELRSLRGDLATLPGAHLDNGFADRVVRAALAAQVADVPPPLELATRPQSRTPKWVYAAAAMLAAAASLLIAVQPWRNNPIDAPAVALSPADQIIYTLRSVAPVEGQALVVRLQVPADAIGSLDEALARAGIETLTNGAAMSLGQAYRDQLGEKLAASTTAAAGAVLVEAPLAAIEQALAAVAGEAKNGVHLLAETKLDWNRAMPVLEGEADKHRAVVGAGARPYAQRLDASLFPLSAELTPSAPISALPAVTATGPARVIILIQPMGAAR